MDEKKSWKCPQCETINDGETEVCAVCGGARAAAEEVTPAPMVITPATSYTSPYSSPAAGGSTLALNKLRKKFRLVCILGAVLLVAACSWGVVLMNRNAQLSDRLAESVMQVDALEEQCQELTADCEEKDKKITSLNKKINELEPKASNWASFVNKANGSNLGYGSSRFYMNKGVVVMSSGTQKLTLTCNYGTHVTVSRTTSGSSAKLSFDQDTWYGSTTTMTLRASTKGITYFTFTNSVDNAKFIVVAIVI